MGRNYNTFLKSFSLFFFLWFEVLHVSFFPDGQPPSGHSHLWEQVPTTPVKSFSFLKWIQLSPANKKTKLHHLIALVTLDNYMTKEITSFTWVSIASIYSTTDS